MVALILIWHIRLLSLLILMEKYAAEDGLESFASSGVEESDEEPDHHLLTMPSGDVEFLFDKPVKLSRELM